MTNFNSIAHACRQVEVFCIGDFWQVEIEECNIVSGGARRNEEIYVLRRAADGSNRIHVGKDRTR